ncbi:hypothetical protein [Streptomyces sp. NBC_00038]|uniref:hypothetical protein n=1 Tax=Streptomyces sp. NBC_00038 TaxID=2903615 RepID=UPI00224D669C|nr:hypothetical protein [Streptomyces sp. NBC_00038]MCX5559521.1 hypothetical protein [Streptomyces sp. NBC_00038]
MSIVVAVLLGCTALAAAVCARITFRLAVTDGASRAKAWCAAGAATMALITDVSTVAASLELGNGHPRAPRIAITVVTVTFAFVLAYVAYDVTGPRLAPTPQALGQGLSRPKRLASAATAFTSTFIVLALVLPLLK